MIPLNLITGMCSYWVSQSVLFYLWL